MVLMLFLTDVGLMVVLSDLSVCANILLMLLTFQTFYILWSWMKPRFSDVFLIDSVIFPLFLGHFKMLHQTFSHKNLKFFRTSLSSERLLGKFQFDSIINYKSKVLVKLQSLGYYKRNLFWKLAILDKSCVSTK